MQIHTIKKITIDNKLLKRKEYKVYKLLIHRHKYNQLFLDIVLLHNLFSLFCCIIFSTLSENDYCLLNMEGQANTHQKTTANM